jgi:hypothetical protein
MPAHKPNESIEGLIIQGHSRKPIRSMPAKKISGMKCFIFKVEFNVFAEIVSALESKVPQIYKDALITIGETLGSDTALIATVAKTRIPNYSQNLISHGSHTHGANEWKFKEHTNAKVITPRQEIINALEKRKCEPFPPT